MIPRKTDPTMLHTTPTTPNRRQHVDVPQTTHHTHLKTHIRKPTVEFQELSGDMLDAQRYNELHAIGIKADMTS